MKFLYSNYREMINTLKRNGYNFSGYGDKNESGKTVILRHDVDFDLKDAVRMAKLENDMMAKSTYFILLSTDFYNIFSKESVSEIKKIMSYGHNVGLHFDEKRYCIHNLEQLEKFIDIEKEIFEKVIQVEIKSVSMHRPSKLVLDNDVIFKNIINSYSQKYFREYKYISDSRMNWREDVISCIDSNIHEKLHILTHPFWYSEEEDTMKGKLLNFINKSKLKRYLSLKDNFRDLDEVIKMEDILDED